MIRKINRIRDYLIFDNFRWPNDLEDFEEYNLIYGWNGTGKTTISNLFQCLEKGKGIENEDGYFEIETDSELLKSSELSNNINSIPEIKVFNKSFVEENIFKTAGDVEPIFVLGEDNILKQKKLEELNKEKDKLSKDFNEFLDNFRMKKEELDDFLIFRAKNIKEILRSSEYTLYNEYDKSNFRNRCNELKDQDFKSLILSEEDFSISIKKINASSPKDLLNRVNIEIPDIEQINADITSLLKEKVVSKTIQRLVEDITLNDWIKTGLEIHKKKKEYICEFCRNEFPPTLLEKYEAHFSVEYNNFISKIDLNISTIEGKIESIKKLDLYDKARFYNELSEGYEQNKTELQAEANKCIDFFNSIVRILKKKKSNPFKVTELDDDIYEIEIEEKLRSINDTITKHNNKTNNFKVEIEEERKKIEKSLVAENLTKYKVLEDKIDEINEKIQYSNRQIENIENKIRSIESEISGHTKSADEINKKLVSYLGHKDIRLIAKEKGYIITIKGNEIGTISEGEKTAVAFTYFLETLKEQGFSLKDSIVVIDDPVSSLDSNSLFHAFGLMKGEVKSAKQVFVLTHNFTLFRQVNNWFKHEKKKCGFYMLINTYSNGQRTAILKKLDILLKKYESEYHYLFSQVHKFSERKDKDLEFYYHLPNIARRLLELFLAFRKPKGKSLYDKIDKMKCDEAKKAKIYRFIQTHSHGEYIEDSSEHDPSILGETPDVLKDILEAIQIEDEEHYNQMIDIVNNQN